jgi:hypothetical protein
MATNETRTTQGGANGQQMLAVMAMLPVRGATALAWLVGLVALLVSSGLGR